MVADIEGTKATTKAAPLDVAQESHSHISKTPSSSNHQHHHHPLEVPGLVSQLSKEAHLLLNGVPSGSQAATINDLFEDPQFLALLHNKLVEVGVSLDSPAQPAIMVIEHGVRMQMEDSDDSSPMLLGSEVSREVAGTVSCTQTAIGANKKGKKLVGTSKKSKKKRYRQSYVEAYSTQWNSIQELVGNKITLGLNSQTPEVYPDSPQECTNISSDDQVLIKETAQSRSTNEAQGEKPQQEGYFSGGDRRNWRHPTYPLGVQLRDRKVDHAFANLSQYLEDRGSVGAVGLPKKKKLVDS